MPNSVRPTGSPVSGSSGLPRYFTPTKPTPGKNGAEPKMAGSKVQPRLGGVAEGVLVGVAQRERHVDAGVVGVGLGHVHVRHERGEQVVDGVAAGRQVDAVLGGVERLEVGRLLQQDRPQRRAGSPRSRPGWCW